MFHKCKTTRPDGTGKYITTFQYFKSNMKDILLEKLKFHYQESDKIDSELNEICKSNIVDLLNDGKYKEAKKYVIDFYGGFEQFSFYRDTLIASINKKILLSGEKL